MNWLRQIFSITAMNIRTMPQRIAVSLVAVVGVAAVVGVFAGVLSMASGFQRTMASSGAEDVAVVLRAGSDGELASGLSAEQVQVIESAPGVLRRDGQPVVSAELYVVVDVEKKSTGLSANVPLRGIQPSGLDVRDNVEIIEGRMFELGKNEFIVGRGAADQFKGLEVGNTIRFGLVEWSIVGMFSDGGGVAESELWSDVRVIQSTYNRGNSFQSARVRLTSPDAIDEFRDALDADPRIDASIRAEREYYSAQAEGLTNIISRIGYPITILMSFGAIFGALNTMYSSISSRSREIATLRSIGFGPMPVLVSVMVESVILAVIGGLIGGGVAYLFFNGYTVSTLAGANFSQVVFNFSVTAGLLKQGLIAAVIIGVVGGLFPAIRAVRVPVPVALREL